MQKDLNNVNIAVTGATGFIGRHLVEELLREGASIEVVTRDHANIPVEWKDRVDVLEADISKNIPKLNSMTKIVFHLAGEINNPKLFSHTNETGTRNMVKALEGIEIERFVHLSSVGVMGRDKEGTFDERDQCFVKNSYERSKLAAEEIVLNAGRDQKVPVSILRPSIVYGPGKKKSDSFLSLIRSVKKKQFRYIGSDESIYNIVYVGDVVEALVYLSCVDKNKGSEIFILNDPVMWKEFIFQTQSLLRSRYKVNTVSGSIAFCLAAGCDIINIFGKKLPFSTTRYKALTSKTVFSAEKINKELGFNLPFGNNKGIAITLEEYKEKGLL